MITNQNIKERENYFIRARSISFLRKSIWSFLVSFGWAIFRRLSPNTIRLIGMPRNIRKLRRHTISELEKDINRSYVQDFSNTNCIGINLKLAVGSITFNGRNTWDENFFDDELEYSLHRWTWLWFDFNSDKITMPAEVGVSLIHSWLASCSNNVTLGSDAYSASERASNGGLFLLTQLDNLKKPDLSNSFKSIGLQITKNLEYFEGDRTGNHALNNARGLLFAGVLSGSSSMIALSSTIIYERLPVLVTPDGFLRECSSHYHFLFTRWILEICWLAERYELDTLFQFLSPYATSLVERCWFFLIRDDTSGQWSIPLIGDISPDVEPSWLLSLPWSKLATKFFKPLKLPHYSGRLGWGSIFGMEDGEVNDWEYKTETYPDSFWHRVVHDDAILFIHAESSTGILRADHKHADLLSFVFYSSGKVIFSDPGRVEYSQSIAGLYGKSSAAHNTIYVNGLSPVSEGDNWFQPSYKSVDVNTKYSISNSYSMFVIKHNGFDRLFGVTVNHERRFIIKKNSFHVEDYLTGKQCCNVQLKFHFCPRINLNKINKNSFALNPEKMKLITDNRLEKVLTKGNFENPISGLSASVYGGARNL
jgi:hypothetical protein